MTVVHRAGCVASVDADARPVGARALCIRGGRQRAGGRRRGAGGRGGLRDPLADGCVVRRGVRTEKGELRAASR